MHGRSVGLTTRLALVGVASALIPFLGAVAVLALLPDDVTARSADQELQRTLTLASARAQEQRADLAFVLARIDDQQLRGIARRGNLGAATTTEIRDTWRNLHGDGPQLDVLLVPPGARPDTIDPMSASVRVRPRPSAAPWTVVVSQPGATDRILRSVVEATDLTIALVESDSSTTAVRGEHATGRIWRVTARDGGAFSFTPEEPGRWRAQVFDASGGTTFIAAVDESKFGLLLRGRGQEFRAALGLLLAAGLLCAITTALLTNRLLGRVASTAERMSSGDFGARLAVVGTDAAARVATSLNELARELQLRIGTLVDTVDRLDRTLAAIDDGVCTWSADGRLETWNSAAASLTGTSAAQARAGAPVADALKAGRAPGRRRVLLPVGDEDSHVVVDLYARRMQDGGTLQVFRDAAQALSIEQARSNFLVTAAHQLRTPLTSILGFAATLADEDLPISAQDRSASIRHVHAEALRLAEVVQSLFEGSLLVRDRIEVDLEPVDVLEALEQVINDGHAPIVELLGACVGVRARADRAALERSLAALLDNAVKYGAPPIQLEVVDDPGSDRIVIIVRDHGTGVPPDMLDAVFEPFHRLDPEMLADVGGAGMGLYNARRLLGAMDATVEVRQSTAVGQMRSCTEFVVMLQRWGERETAGLLVDSRTDVTEPSLRVP